MPKAKLVLVTGASSGLGYQLALCAARDGHHVLALGQSQGALDALADEIDQTTGDVTLVPMDISDPEALSFLANSIADKWGALDLWLHAAWFTPPLQAAAHPLEKDIDKGFAINQRATALLIARLTPLLAEGKAAFFDHPALDGAYFGQSAAHKAAQMATVRAWQSEVAKIGPKVEIFTPTPFYSQLTATHFPGKSKDEFASAADEAAKIWQALAD